MDISANRRRGALLTLLCALGLLLGAGPAHADGADRGADIQVAQTLGERELTVVIRAVEPVPGPVHVDVVTHAGSPPGELALWLSTSGVQFSATRVGLGAVPGFHRATLSVDRAGPWELAIDDGSRTATIPFVVPAKVKSPAENTVYGGFVAAGILLLAALFLALRGHALIALAPAAGMVAALAVAVTAALLSATVPPPPAPGSVWDPTYDSVADPYARTQQPAVDPARPPVTVLADQVGEDLRLTLADSATGQPVDDLLVHDNALVHLAVVSPSGRLWHLHPVRVGPGDYRARLIAPETGRYAVAAELARRGGGRQLARTSLRLNEIAPSTAQLAPVELHRRIEPAGTPSTLTARFGTADLQPWLGMLGHLIVVGPLRGEVADAPVWAHVHSMIPPTAGQPGKPDESVAAYGPDVPFTYTFPLPGRYLVWAQAERGYAVRTVAAEVIVPEAAR
ncbi:hypothetical protein N8J89_12220 [Crossiella sp. CA-258035]|uniref:hypothetical protein n=1 Tax=Crossiella sp. CA-258035 TaxID=2981138 RepID=UPI0024BD126E|nr:hypothetical protein [Crossiella sp. CA-258035]WHT21789.1 hypothetical protein N8J89_12220 [Crossiella sp. CA-258035]